MELQETNFYTLECPESASLKMALVALSALNFDLVIERSYTAQKIDNSGLISNMVMMKISIPVYQLKQVEQIDKILGVGA